MIKPEDIINDKGLLIRETENLITCLIDSIGADSIPREFLDLETNKNYGGYIINDLGDYAPFVAFLGKLKDPKYFLWANRVSRNVIRKCQMPNGLFYPNSEGDTEKNSNFRIFDADSMSDIILGVNLMYEISKDRFYLHASNRFFDGFADNFLSKEGYVYFRVCPRIFKIPFTTGKFAGLYIEEAVNLYKYTKNDKYLEIANKIAEPWLNNEFVKEEGLFPFVFFNKKTRPIAELIFKKETSFDFDTVMMTKSNTNLIDGLVSINLISQKQEITAFLDKWVDNTKNKIFNNGELLSVWSRDKKYNLKYLASDHAVVNSLIGIYQTTKNDKAINLASDILDSIINKQSKEGLFPETLESYDYEKINKRMLNLSMTMPNISRLDTQTDLGVVLLKFYETTNNKRYLDVALSLICGVINHHKYKDYYVEFVDTKTLDKKDYIVRTKMLFLLSKFFILTNHILEGKKIYDDEIMQNLLRDR